MFDFIPAILAVDRRWLSMDWRFIRGSAIRFPIVMCIKTFLRPGIEPVHVYATEGAPLTISCSVDARCRSRYNASSVYFLKTVPEFYTNSSRVRLASPHRIQLEIPAVQEWRDRGLWLCLVDGVPGHGLAKYTAHVDFSEYLLCMYGRNWNMWGVYVRWLRFIFDLFYWMF